MSTRSVAVVTVMCAGFVAVLLSAVLIPWRTASAPAARVSTVGSSPPLEIGPQTALPVAETQDFTREELIRAEAFAAAVRPPVYLGLAAGVVVALLLGFTRWGARLIGAVPVPAALGWPGTVAAGGIALAVVVTVVALPFAAWAHAVRRAHGLTDAPWALWLTDMAKGAGLTALALVAGGLVLFGLIRVLPRGWPAAAAAVATAGVLALSLLFPVLVEPLYARFTPLPEGELRTSLLELAARDGIEVSEVLVADASRRTNALNAYVSGFGPTRRIVVYDTLLAAAPAHEVELVVAHELGHAVRRDVLVGSAIAAAGMGLVAGMLGLVLTSAAVLAHAGLRGPADPRALALVLAVVTAAGLVGTPVQSALSRRIETRADLHALELTADPQGYAEMQRRLAVANLADVDPPGLLHVVFGTHPTTRERIRLARAWAAATGKTVPGPLAP